MNLELDYQAWMTDAVCASVDPECFFPEQGEASRAAKRICNTACTVREQCLQYALDHYIREGVWGGTTGAERRRLQPPPERPTARAQGTASRMNHCQLCPFRACPGCEHQPRTSEGTPK